MFTVTHSPAVAIKPFADGRHKHGGVLYHCYVTGVDGKVARVTLGVVAKMPASFTASRPEQQYLVNDWTAPNFIGSVRQDNVRYFAKRAHAMAFVNEIAERFAR